MVPQERDLITTLLTRLKSAGGQPKDPEADGLIRQAMAEQPDAPYYLVQTVLIQDLSLHSAQNRIAELERQLAEAQSAQSSHTSFLGGLLGRNQPAPVPQPSPGPWSRGPQVAAAPPPGYAPQYAPQQGYAQPGYAPSGGGMFGGGGGGFLRSAAATAAGVAGGALLFEGISSLFGHSYASGLGGFGGMGGMGTGLGETVINNYNGDSGGAGDYGGGGGGDYGGGGGGGDYAGGGGGDYGGGGGDYGGGGGGGDYGGGGGGDYDGGGGGDYGGGDNSSSC